MSYTKNTLLACSIACVAFSPLTGLAQTNRDEALSKYDARSISYMAGIKNPVTKKMEYQQAMMAYHVLTPAGFDVTDTTKKYPVLVTLHGSGGVAPLSPTPVFNEANLEPVNFQLVGYDPGDERLNNYAQLRSLMGKSQDELDRYVNNMPQKSETFLLAQYNPGAVDLTQIKFTTQNLQKFVTQDYPDLLSKFSDIYPNIQSNFPTYVVAPQSPGLWDLTHLAAVKEIIRGLPNVDMDRIYVVGQSAGGNGVFTFAAADPDYFAGAIAVSAGGSNVLKTVDLDKLANFNIWTLHGADDNGQYTPYKDSVRVFDFMKAKSSRMKFTTVYNRGHSTGNLIIGLYQDTGSFLEVLDTGPKTETLKRYNYKTDYAGLNPDANGDREADTMKWLFSKRRLPNYSQYNAWSNAKLLKQGPYGDDDADGKTNYAEFIAGTNPLSASSK
jgi:pimeloyl-ACP methyl ester carboxylesterase